MNKVVSHEIFSELLSPSSSKFTQIMPSWSRMGFVCLDFEPDKSFERGQFIIAPFGNIFGKVFKFLNYFRNWKKKIGENTEN
jgi:hypothetical protein